MTKHFGEVFGLEMAKRSREELFAKLEQCRTDGCGAGS